MTRKLTSPTPAQVLAMRQAANLTQAQAAARVYASSYRTWQDWERGVRNMPVAIFELWKLQDKLNEKTTLRLDDLIVCPTCGQQCSESNPIYKTLGFIHTLKSR